MILYKVLLVVDEGLIFGLLAIGVYIAFQWLRFPDLTPDGSFTLGACFYAVAVGNGVTPVIGIVMAAVAGALAGSCTAGINKLVGVPTVVAGLLVSSSLYSLTWLLLGKPNQFLEPTLTLVGDVSGFVWAWHLLLWLCVICAITVILLNVFAGSIWGLRVRAIGENPLLAHDIRVSESRYTFLCLSLSNGLVGLAGALFAQRSFSADINMGVGVTIIGLTGMILGLLLTRGRRKIFIIILSVLAGSILHRGVVFITLEAGMPAESFRLISALVLVLIFFLIKNASTSLLKNLKWN